MHQHVQQSGVSGLAHLLALHGLGQGVELGQHVLHLGIVLGLELGLQLCLLALLVPGQLAQGCQLLLVDPLQLLRPSGCILCILLCGC